MQISLNFYKFSEITMMKIMDTSKNQFNEQHILNLLKDYMTENQISYARLARHLGYKTPNVTRIAYHGSKLFKNENYQLTLSEVGKIADLLEMNAMDLLRPAHNSTGSKLQSTGDHNTNVVQHGSRNSIKSVGEGRSDKVAQLEKVLSLPAEERKIALEILNNAI